MKSLINKRTNQILIPSVLKAGNLKEKTLGLLGKESQPEDQALWIPYCPVIHTFFMKFPIDVIFTNKNLIVVSVFHNIPSGRILFGGWSSQSVFEMKAGTLKQLDIKTGDQLYVGR